MNLDGFFNVLNRFGRGIDNKVTKVLLDKLGKYGVEYAKSQVMNIDTGETVDSINYKVEGNKLTIEAGGNAIWLEFGTGIARNPSEYPVQVEGIVGHGQYGQGRGASPQGWYYPSDGTWAASHGQNTYDAEIGQYTYSGTYLAHTLGIEQNMFMWKTIDVLEQKAAEWGLEIINTELHYD